MILQCNYADEGCGLSGVKEPSGRSAERPRKRLPETVLSQRGLFSGKGKMVISIVSKHYEDDTNMMGSMR